MILFIDSSNIVTGGGKTHLIELIKCVKPSQYGFEKVVLYGTKYVMGIIPNKEWLLKISPSLFNYGYVGRLIWQVFYRSKPINGIWFVPGAGRAPGRYVTMCQNLLPIDVQERKRYFFSLTWVRLVMLGFIHQDAFRKAAGVIFLNEYCFKSLPVVIQSKVSRIAFIPHGVSEIFTPLSTGKKDVKTFALIYVSTIDVYKHQWKIAEAVEELLDEGYAIGIDFIGHANPTALAKLNPYLSESIRYLGPVSYSDLPARYAAFDVFIFGSTCETFGMVLLEAMASGLPVLSSNRSSMPETLGEHALYFDPLDVVAIKEAILKLYKNDSLRRDLREKGIHYAKQFTWAKTSQDTFRFIQDCCKG